MTVRAPSVDLIQVFCANFPCDIDLRQPPGVNRLRTSIKWPVFDQCPSFVKLDNFEKLIQIQRLEINLKISRYSLETLQLVLAEEFPPSHLVLAIRNHYSVTPVEEGFYADYIVRALVELSILPTDVDQRILTTTAVTKFGNWLEAAVQKCRSIDV